ncbi:DNA repair protein [Roseovarius sp. C7]|uniref:DNA repair protein n=1 Tax=Roseovarius sp. C7 TaxID=3398643 RepID=UPI0039F4F71D
MGDMTKTATGVLFTLSQYVSGLILAATAFALAITTGLSAFGVLPWLDITAAFGAQPIEQAGIWLQSGVTVLMLLLLFYLPSHFRVVRLENSHRQFHLSMQDVARAYAAVHAEDRKGAFRMSSEFDAVRERLVHLRDHPDLGSLEPEVLEIAAQMSQVSHELAETYSDRNVTRARDFLRQRQEEVEQLEQRIVVAQQINSELRRWTQEVEIEESMAESQLRRLRDDLREILPELDGLDVEPGPTQPRVIGLPHRAAAE